MPGNRSILFSDARRVASSLKYDVVTNIPFDTLRSVMTPSNSRIALGPKSVWDLQEERDAKRIALIKSTLESLVSRFLSDQISLQEFKSQIDGINKKNEYWGFSGIKGQMFFNMVYNTADNLDELRQELKAAITVPKNEEIASSRIKTFASFVKRLGDQHLEAGGSKHGRPKLSSTPFFLSYFWQIQARDIWPVYYTNSVKVMTDLNLWTPSGGRVERRLRTAHQARMQGAESGVLPAWRMGRDAEPGVVIRQEHGTRSVKFGWVPAKSTPGRRADDKPRLDGRGELTLRTSDDLTN